MSNREPIPIADQIAEVERQLQTMRDTYPRWVAEGKIAADRAEKQMARFEAVANSLVDYARIKAGAI